MLLNAIEKDKSVSEQKANWRQLVEIMLDYPLSDLMLSLVITFGWVSIKVPNSRIGI
jgi:hypothetical protein